MTVLIAPGASKAQASSMTIAGEIIVSPPSARVLQDAAYAENLVPGDCESSVAMDAIAMAQTVGEHATALQAFKDTVLGELAEDSARLDKRGMHTETAFASRAELLEQLDSMFTTCVVGDDTDRVWLAQLERKGKALEKHVEELAGRLEDLSSHKAAATQAVTEAFEQEQKAFGEMSRFKMTIITRIKSGRRNEAIRAQRAELDTKPVQVDEAELATYLDVADLARLEVLIRQSGELKAAGVQPNDVQFISVKAAIINLYELAADKKRSTLLTQLPAPVFDRTDPTEVELRQAMTDDEQQIYEALKGMVSSFGATSARCIEQGDKLSEIIQAVEQERDAAIRELQYAQDRYNSIRNTSLLKRQGVIDALEVTLKELIADITELSDVDMTHTDCPMPSPSHAETVTQNALLLEQLELQFAQDVAAELERDPSLEPAVQELLCRRGAIIHACHELSSQLPQGTVLPDKIQYKTTLLSTTSDGTEYPVEVTRTINVNPMGIQLMCHQQNVRQLTDVLDKIRAKKLADFQQRAKDIHDTASYHERIVDNRILQLTAKPEPGTMGGLIYTLPELARRAHNLELMARKRDEEAGLVNDTLERLTEQKEWDEHARLLHLADIVRLAGIMTDVHTERAAIIEGHQKTAAQIKDELARWAADAQTFTSLSDVNEAMGLAQQYAGYEAYGLPSSVERPVDDSHTHFDPAVNRLTGVLRTINEEQDWAERRRDVTSGSIVYLRQQIASAQNELRVIVADSAKLRGVLTDKERTTLQELAGVLTASQGALMSLQSSYAETTVHIPASVEHDSQGPLDDSINDDVGASDIPTPKPLQSNTQAGRQRKPQKIHVPLRDRLRLLLGGLVAGPEAPEN